MTDTAVAPIRTAGCRTVADGGGDVLECAGVGGGHEDHRQIRRVAELLEDLADDLTGRRGSARGCSERAAANGIVQATGGSRVYGHHGRLARRCPAVGFDGAVVVERQLGPHQPVVELSRLDLERLHVAGDLLAVGR